MKAKKYRMIHIFRYLFDRVDGKYMSMNITVQKHIADCTVQTSELQCIMSLFRFVNIVHVVRCMQCIGNISSSP